MSKGDRGASELEVFLRETKQIENEALIAHANEKHIPAFKTPHPPPPESSATQGPVVSLWLGLCLNTGIFVVLGIESKLRSFSEKTWLAIIGLCNFLLTASIHFLCAAHSIWGQSMTSPPNTT